MKRFLKWTGFASGAAGLGLVLYLVAIQLTGNFDVVVPGEAYRSSQPTPADLATYTERYKIRTVINLRGREERAAWYKNEAAAAKQLGLNLIDFPLRSSQRLDVKTANELVTILRDAPRPILIHCRSGADRTGLASVIYLARIAQVDEKTAERQLSIRYGHFSLPFSPTYAMDESWEDMEAAAGTES